MSHQTSLYNATNVENEIYENAKQLFKDIWTGKPGSQSGFPSISCLSYNERSNWLTITSLGFHVRKKDCQPSPYCSVRFEQVEP